MTKVDHVQATELFSAYWDEQLEKTQVSALEEHLQSCVTCRREFKAFEKTIDALGSLDKKIAPPDFARAVRSRIRSRSRGRFFSSRRLSERVPYELFSLVMLGVILAIYVVLALTQPSQLKIP